MSARNIDPEQIISLDFFSSRDTSKLLGAVVALSGEVFILKAQVERLTAALYKSGVVSESLVNEIGDSPDMQKWMSAEAAAQARAVLESVLEPDQVDDVRALMRSE